MSDALALRVVEERVGLLPTGSVFQIKYVDAHAHEDTPVLDAVRRELRREVAYYASEDRPPVDAGDVPIEEVSPEDMRDAWRDHAPMSAPPQPDTYALVAYWKERP